jgi:hypothetical protein
MWADFLKCFTPRDQQTWANRRYQAPVKWLGAPPPPDTPVQIYEWAGQPRVLAADGAPLGTVQAALNPARAGLVRAQVARNGNMVDIVYLGPDDIQNM